jgi:hypothetical protein
VYKSPFPKITKVSSTTKCAGVCILLRLEKYTTLLGFQGYLLLLLRQGRFWLRPNRLVVTPNQRLIKSTTVYYLDNAMQIPMFF